MQVCETMLSKKISIICTNSLCKNVEFMTEQWAYCKCENLQSSLLDFGQ